MMNQIQTSNDEQNVGIKEINSAVQMLNEGSTTISSVADKSLSNAKLLTENKDELTSSITHIHQLIFGYAAAMAANHEPTQEVREDYKEPEVFEEPAKIEEDEKVVKVDFKEGRPANDDLDGIPKSDDDGFVDL